MIGSLAYGDKVIAYDVVFSSVLREKIRIHVHPNSCIEVEAPYEHCLTEIQRAVRKRARWIFNQLENASNFKRHALPREYVSGETHFYIGKRYQLKVIEDRNAGSTVKLKSGRIEVVAPVADPVAIKRRLNEWYVSKAEHYFKKRVGHVMARISWLKHEPPIKLVSMKKQWGSCSPDGVLHLNPWLIRAPVDCIDYVIMHEICHLRERNHSKQYYELLSAHLTDWQHVKAKLDGMAELLLAT